MLGGYVPQYISEYEADNFLCGLVDSWGNLAKDSKVIRTALAYGMQSPLTLAENYTQLHTEKETHQEQHPQQLHKSDNTKSPPAEYQKALSSLIEVFGELEQIPPEWQTNDFKPYLSDDSIKSYQDIGNSDISDLKRYYSSLNAYPNKIIMLSAGEVVTDLQKCIDRQLSCIAESSGATRQTYVDRLKAIKREIELHQLADAI